MSNDHALPSGLRERVRGMLLGAAVGDALGWPQEQRSGIAGGRKARRVAPRMEFRSWRRNAGSRFNQYQETVGAGEYSDDTQMLLAVARACLSGDWQERFAHTEVPAWLLYQRGGGRAMRNAAQAWAQGSSPWQQSGSAAQQRAGANYFNAGANGVAMRIAPHVILTAADPPTTTLERVIKDGICTHGHPRALVGAALHALALRHAVLRRGTLGYGEPVLTLLAEPAWQQPTLIEQVAPSAWLDRYQHAHDQPATAAWKETVEETRGLLQTSVRALGRAALASDEETLAELGTFDQSRNGAGHITAVAAAYSAARAAARPQSGLLLTAFLDHADTDTLASMTASLLGAIHGTEWLQPLDRQVQDWRYVITMADRLANAAAHAATPQLLIELEPSAPPSIGRREIEVFHEALEELKESGDGVFVDGRRFSVTARAQLNSAKSITAIRWQLDLDDGQTIFIDRVSRRRDTPVSGGPRRPPSTADQRRASTNPPRSPAPRGKQSAELAKVTLVVRDVDQSARFYRDVFGLRVSETAEGALVGDWLSLARSTKGNPPEPSRFLHFTVRAGDLNVVWQAAHDFGVEVLDPRPDSGRNRIRLYDPDGNQIAVESR